MLIALFGPSFSDGSHSSFLLFFLRKFPLSTLGPFEQIRFRSMMNLGRFGAPLFSLCFYTILIFCRFGAFHPLWTFHNVKNNARRQIEKEKSFFKKSKTIEQKQKKTREKEQETSQQEWDKNRVRVLFLKTSPAESGLCPFRVQVLGFRF